MHVSLLMPSPYSCIDRLALDLRSQPVHACHIRATMCWAASHEVLMQKSHMEGSLLLHILPHFLFQIQTMVPRSTNLRTATYLELDQQETAGARMHPSAAKERPGRSPAGAWPQQTLS
jgi:hypothetical protein